MATKNLQTVRLKPNPKGKDRTRSGASETQLGAEWADIKNVGRHDENLSGVNLFHKAYKQDGTWDWELVKVLSGTLKPGQVMRVHSGRGPLSVLRAEDLEGADYHVFAGESRYLWNNDRGDTAALWLVEAKDFVDRTSYDGVPPEGVVLHRVGDKLVPLAAPATRAYSNR